MKLPVCATSFILAIGLLACAPLKQTSPDSPPTQAAAVATSGSQPISATASPSIGPVESPEPQSLYPAASIEILSPVTAFTLTSPFELIARLPEGHQGAINIELLGTDGRLLLRKLIVLDEDLRPDELLRMKIAFEIPSEAENGRLRISINDEFGRLRALSSVDLILQSTGERTSFTSPEFPEKIWIQAPLPGSIQESGLLKISGIGFPQSQRPYSVQIINREGRVLAFGEAYPKFSPENDFGTFELTLEISVAEEQWLQLGIRETGAGIPGDVHFSSIEFLLLPPRTDE